MARQPEAAMPPNDLTAEAAVLSAVMLDAAAMDRAALLLRPEQFYSESHRRIFEACLSLYRESVPVDVVQVGTRLRGTGRLEQVGGMAYVTALLNAAPAVVNVEAYATTVSHKHQLRQLILTCQRVTAEAYAGVEDVPQFVDRAEQAIYEIARSAVDRPRLEPIGVPVAAEFERWQEFDKRRADGELPLTITGVPTGIAELDYLLAGLHDGELTVIASRPGMGKAQPLDSLVFTPTGWRKVGGLRIGDRVIGADGFPKLVTGYFPRGVRETFRVTMSDGGTAECCGEHLWLTRTRSDRRNGLRGSVKSTTVVRDTMIRSDADRGRNHSVPFMCPAQLDPIGPLPIHPYLLGVILGDGGLTSSCVIISNPEEYIKRRVSDLVPSGDAVSIDGMTIRIRRAIRSGATSTTKSALVDLGLSGRHSWEKFIPEMYLRASVEDREHMLRGLCDTDGHVVDSGTMVEFSTTSPQMLEGIRFLVGSLGGRMTLTRSFGAYKRDGTPISTRPAFRCWISFPSSAMCPVSSPKHMSRWKGGRLRVQERFISSVEPTGQKECACISIAATDGLYVTDDFIVTHNTSLACDIAVNVARVRDPNGAQPFASAMFSLEMPKEQIADRAMCSGAEVDLSKARRGAFTPVEWSRIVGSANELTRLDQFVINDTPALSLTAVRSILRDCASEFARRGKRLRLAVVDYLQLMSAEGRHDSREQAVASLSRGLKAMAKELRIPVVALAQLNRAVEQRADKRPNLSDLRESGQIEQDADNVIFVYRDEYYNDDSPDRGIAELIVEKQRNGPTGTVRVRFEPQFTRFSNLPPESLQ